MGQYVDLLRSLPKTKRDVAARAEGKDPEIVRVAKRYGWAYFDGPRKFGYGGYHYDGRWRSVASDIMDQYDLWHTGPLRILDVGCAKGFLVHDLQQLMHPDLDCHVYGIDVSRYAVRHWPHPDVVGRLHLGSAVDLPFPDKSFDLVLSINTLHNLPRAALITALREMRRVSRGSMFVQVDSYRTEEEKALFEQWVLTAETHGTPEFWLGLFEEAGYDGDYAWTIVEAGGVL